MTHPEQVASAESQQVGGPVDEHLLRAYREQAEATADEPLSPAATRPASGRVKVLSVRLNPEEFDELTRYADVRDVPVSGLVRGWVLDHLRAQPDSPAAAVERIAAELEQLRRHLVTWPPGPLATRNISDVIGMDVDLVDPWTVQGQQGTSPGWPSSS